MWHLLSFQAVRLVADLCLEYRVYDPQLWNSLLQKLLGFNLVRGRAPENLPLKKSIYIWKIIEHSVTDNSVLTLNKPNLYGGFLLSDRPPAEGAGGSSGCAGSVGGKVQLKPCKHCRHSTFKWICEIPSDSNYRIVKHLKCNPCQTEQLRSVS